MTVFANRGAGIRDVPVIDLTSDVARRSGAIQETAEQLRDALEQVGFFAVINHGIPQAMIDGIFTYARQFHALSQDRKIALTFSSAFTGYIPPAAYVLRTSKPILVDP